MSKQKKKITPEKHEQLLDERQELTNRVELVTASDDSLEPMLSVIVPIYNAEYTLEQALDSLEKQTYENIEIICVNDASPDESHLIIKEHADKDKRYVRVRHAYNCGYGASMNDGIAVARGEWIAILEPDDYLFPDAYKSLLDMVALYGNRQIDVVKSPYIREVRDEGVQRGDMARELLNCSYRGRVRPARQPFDMTDASASHLLRHHPSIWSAIYRRDFLVDNEIFFVEYPGAGWADNEFFYETLLQAKNILYTDVPYYVYREETDAEVLDFARKNKTLPFDRWNSMNDIIERLGITDEHILRSHISKGFTYLNGQIEGNGTDDEIIENEMDKMFQKMPYELVEKEEQINPGLRRLFYDYTEQDGDMSAHKRNYMKSLVSEFWYTMRNNGMPYTMKKVKHVLKK